MRKLLKIDILLKFSKIITLVSLGVSIAAVISALSYTYYINKMLIKEKVYILDGNGEAFTAKVLKEELMYREPEIYNHLKIFHKFFFNLDQFNYSTSIEKALNLIDESGKNYYLTLLNEGWYNTLKMNNLVQDIEFDSIHLNAKVYPYLASVFGKTSVYRYGEKKEEKIKKIEISCTLFDVARTKENPHGLLISNYNILHHGEE